MDTETSPYELLYAHVLSRVDAERIHHLTLNMLAAASRVPPTLALLRALYAPRTPYPPISLWGKTFAHPLGLAAGFDKDARCVPALAALGFSFVEVGTITPKPQAGNPRPRLFRLTEDRALINRMGFPSGGIDALNEPHPPDPLSVNREGEKDGDTSIYGGGRAEARPYESMSCHVWISIGKNKDTPLTDAVRDYRAVLDALYTQGDAFVVNVSSPNTPQLRALQTRAYLDDLLAEMMRAIRAQGGDAKPLLVKIAPDLTWDEIDTITELALAHSLGGIIATNTTTARDGLRSPYQHESGGLSGAPLRARSTAIIQHIRQHAPTLPIIGVGGVFSGDDVWEKLAAGATLVQAYTGFVYRGPAFVRRVLAELAEKEI